MERSEAERPATPREATVEPASARMARPRAIILADGPDADADADADRDAGLASASAANDSLANDSLAIEPVAVESCRGSLSDRAYRSICDKLVFCSVSPGHRFILRPLALELGLSPTPVREALLRLVSEQALVLDERGSAVVPVMTIETFEELNDMRGDLECRAIERMIAVASDAQIAALELIHAGCAAAYRDGDRHQLMLRNLAFHRAVCASGRSPLTRHALEGLWLRLGPIFAPSMGQALPPIEPASHPHARMIDALRRRHVGDARAAALADVTEGYRYIAASIASS